MARTVKRRGPGRPVTPPEYALSSPVLVRLPASVYALLEAEADSRGESLAATARDLLTEALERASVETDG